MPDVILNLLPVREEEKAAFEAAAPDAVHLYAGRRTATPEQFAQANIVMGWPREDMLAQAPRLRWFHCMWAGTDKYAGVLPPSVLLTSSAGINSQSVAEHMLAALLSLYRKLPQSRDHQRERAWVDVGNLKSLDGTWALRRPWAGLVSWWPARATWAPPSPSCARPWARGAPSA